MLQIIVFLNFKNYDIYIYKVTKIIIVYELSEVKSNNKIVKLYVKLKLIPYT